MIRVPMIQKLQVIIILRHVVDQYERTISDLLTGLERQRVLTQMERETLKGQRDQAKEDLFNADRALNDVAK